MKKILSILALALAASSAFADDVQESKLNKIPTLIVIDTDEKESVEKAWRVAESIRAGGFDVSVLTCTTSKHELSEVCSKLREDVKSQTGSNPGVFVY